MKRKKVLIIKFHAIGDVVHSTVIPYVIKQKHPECEIHFLTSAGNAVLLSNCPYIDKTLEYKNDKIKTLKQLFKERYDTIISLNYTLTNYLLTFLSFPKQIFFRSYKGTSWVENYFYTAKKVFKDVELPDRLHFESKNSKTKSYIADKINTYPRPYTIINPGKLKDNPRQGRTWNINNWKTLAKNILNQYGGTVFVTGNKKEQEYHNKLNDNNIVVLSGLFSLEESCSVLSMADLVISGDSGPIHIASAFNVKTLAILGSTSPEKIKPYGKNGYFIGPKNNCKYCWKKKCPYIRSDNEYAPCMESITPQIVMDKISSCNLLKTNIDHAA